MKSKNPWEIEIMEPLLFLDREGYYTNIILTCYLNIRIVTDTKYLTKELKDKAIKELQEYAQKYKNKTRITKRKY